jgi:hypothetical protein
MKRMIAWESQLEQKACYHFEFSPAVIAFREQPETLYFPCQQGMCRYTPDFQLTLYNGEIIYVEVKPLFKLFLPKILERLQLANEFLAEKGYSFIVLTDEELNFSNRIRNFSILRPYLRLDIPDYISNQAKAWLTHTSNPTFQSLSLFLGLQSTACALLAQLHIGFDFDEPLNNTSQLSPKFIGDQHETCFFSYRTGPNFGQCTIPPYTHP